MKQFTIGRSKENDIIIDDTSVSRHHATIIQTASGIVISDNGSSNGTFINGIRIQGECTLLPNDILKLGTALFPWKNYINLNNSEAENRTRIVLDTPQIAANLSDNDQFVENPSEEKYLAESPDKSNAWMRVLSVIGFLLSLAAIAAKVYYSSRK